MASQDEVSVRIEKLPSRGVNARPGLVRSVQGGTAGCCGRAEHFINDKCDNSRIVSGIAAIADSVAVVSVGGESQFYWSGHMSCGLLLPAMVTSVLAFVSLALIVPHAGHIGSGIDRIVIMASEPAAIMMPPRAPPQPPVPPGVPPSQPSPTSPSAPPSVPPSSPPPSLPDPAPPSPPVPPISPAPLLPPVPPVPPPHPPHPRRPQIHRRCPLSHHPRHRAHQAHQTHRMGQTSQLLSPGSWWHCTVRCALP